jgi:hypothetical protein
VASIDKGLPDLALARVQIWSVMAGAEVGYLDLACTVIKEVLPPSADLLSMNRRGSAFC